jgi:uncharacterized protein (TIGR04255 family)
MAKAKKSKPIVASESSTWSSPPPLKAPRRKVLKNKPLVEAILEIKWALTTRQPGIAIDPHYKILLGRLYDRVSGEYPEHEQLPTATMPDEIVGQMVQHRFRKGPNDWPLLQIGPGILTVNDTHKYIWEDFSKRSIEAVNKLYEAHPKVDELKIESLLLRYIDAVDFDHISNNVFDFLREKMRVEINLPGALFQDGIQNRPRLFNWQASFECTTPKGIVNLRFATGQRDERPVLLWESMVQSLVNEVPDMPQNFGDWIESAHIITDDWFFTLIEGELERRFSGE